MGALGEFIAAIAVLITLIYLTVQIKQTQLAVSANTHQALNDISIHLYTAVATCESLATALAASVNEEVELTETQITQCHSFWTAMIRNAENMHFQFKIGLLGEERIRISAEVLKRHMKRNKHFRQLWNSLDMSLRPEFKVWIESVFLE